MQMPFGKHEGEEIEDVPVSYLRWLSKNVELYGKLADEVKYILEGYVDDSWEIGRRKELHF